MHILTVGSDSERLRQLEKKLTIWGYAISKAETEDLAIEHLNRSRVDMIIIDWQLPEMDGLELSRKIRSLDIRRYIYILVINAKDIGSDVVRSAEGIIDDCLAKPLNLKELQGRLDNGARIVQLERELNQKYLTIKRNYDQTVQMFTQMLCTFNENLGNHSKRVGQIALTLARRHQAVAAEDYPVIEAAGLLHDIGLVGLPHSLVEKSVQEMTGDEKERFHTHPERGETILSRIDLLKSVAAIVRCHHEQINGRGFPDGISGSQIPLGASIVGAASYYDNLVHRNRWPYAAIFEKLQQERNYRIPSDLVDILLEINLENMEEESRRTHTEVDIDRLKPGMVLAADIHMKSGAFVMGSDTRIDAGIIGKLRKYYDLGNISDKVFISK